MENTGGVSDGRTRARLLPVPLLRRDAMVLLLTWVAGSVDALSYLGLGRVFTANMTGNTVLLGLAIGQGQGLAAVHALLALTGFILGVALGALIVERDRTREDWPVAVTGALALEGGLLSAFTLTWVLIGGTVRNAGVEDALIALSAVAMGLQSVAVRHLGVAGIVTTYITGTWTSFVVGLVAGMRPAERSQVPTGSGEDMVGPPLLAGLRFQGLGLQAAVLLIYGVAAISSGFVEAHWPSCVPFLPLVAIGLVVVNASLRHRSRPSPSR